jgi:hypothetical protein
MSEKTEDMKKAGAALTGGPALCGRSRQRGCMGHIYANPHYLEGIISDNSGQFWTFADNSGLRTVTNNLELVPTKGSDRAYPNGFAMP